MLTMLSRAPRAIVAHVRALGVEIGEVSTRRSLLRWLGVCLGIACVSALFDGSLPSWASDGSEKKQGSPETQAAPLPKGFGRRWQLGSGVVQSPAPEPQGAVLGPLDASGLERAGVDVGGLLTPNILDMLSERTVRLRPPSRTPMAPIVHRDAKVAGELASVLSASVVAPLQPLLMDAIVLPTVKDGHVGDFDTSNLPSFLDTFYHQRRAAATEPVPVPLVPEPGSVVLWMLAMVALMTCWMPRWSVFRRAPLVASRTT